MRSGAIVNETVEDDDVLLDGARIMDSTFRRCTLIYRGERPSHAEGSEFFDCRVVFEGPAALTVGLLKTWYSVGGGFRSLAEDAIREIRGTATPSP